MIAVDCHEGAPGITREGQIEDAKFDLVVCRAEVSETEIAELDGFAVEHAAGGRLNSRGQLGHARRRALDGPLPRLSFPVRSPGAIASEDEGAGWCAARSTMPVSPLERP